PRPRSHTIDSNTPTPEPTDAESSNPPSKPVHSSGIAQRLRDNPKKRNHVSSVTYSPDLALSNPDSSSTQSAGMDKPLYKTTSSEALKSLRSKDISPRIKDPSPRAKNESSPRRRIAKSTDSVKRSHSYIFGRGRELKADPGSVSGPSSSSSPRAAPFSSTISELIDGPAPVLTSGFERCLDCVAEETAELINHTLLTDQKYYFENAVHQTEPIPWRKISGFDWFKKHFAGRKYNIYLGEHPLLGSLFVLFLQQRNGDVRSMFATQNGIEVKHFTAPQLSKLGLGSIQITAAQKKKWTSKLLARINGCLASDETKLNQVGPSEPLEKRIIELETFQAYNMNRTTTNFKLGVLYADDTTVDESSLFMKDPSDDEDYAEFLSFLGDKVPIDTPDVYTGGLSSADSAHILHSIHATRPDVQIMYHVNSWILPQPTAQDTIFRRKRHIGNDSIVIVFNKSNSPFDPSIIKSQYIQCYFVIEKQKPSDIQRAQLPAFSLSRTLTDQLRAAEAGSLRRIPSDEGTDALDAIPPLQPSVSIDHGLLGPMDTVSPSCQSLHSALSEQTTSDDSSISEIRTHSGSPPPTSHSGNSARNQLAIKPSQPSPFAQLSPDIPHAGESRKCICRVYLDAKRFKTVSLKLPATFGELRVAVAEKCRETDSSIFVIAAERGGAEIEPLGGFPSNWDIGTLISHWDATYRLLFKAPSSPLPPTKADLLESHHYPFNIINELFSAPDFPETRYRLALCVKEGVAPWPPAFPQVSWFPANEIFREFLHNKLVGAQYACHFSPLWSARFGRSRKLSLEEINPFIPH
ncbi:MAG: GTPase-activating protein, partial [archaeon]|nr:GTPase-activating protein [archaeon]